MAYLTGWVWPTGRAGPDAGASEINDCMRGVVQITKLPEQALEIAPHYIWSEGAKR